MSEAPPLSKQSEASLLAAYLAGRDTLCPRCNYNLRDLTVDRCPECGEQLVLRINAAQPRQGAAIAGLIGLAAGTGFSGCLLLYLLIQAALSNGLQGLEIVFFWLTLIPFIIEGAFLSAWLIAWKRIACSSPRWRRILVILAWAATLLNVWVFTKLVP